MPQSYEFDSGHADEIGHADLDAAEQVLNEVIQECQHSLEGIKHVRLAFEAGFGIAVSGKGAGLEGMIECFPFRFASPRTDADSGELGEGLR